MGNETWMAIPGYEGLYSVSNCGRVYSHRRNSCLKPIVTKAGYVRVHLADSGKIKVAPIHRLVVLAFIPNPENKPTVNHLNEIKTDNRVENLEWATMAEQNVHGTRIERAVAHTDWKNRNIDYAAGVEKHDYHNINKAQMKPVLQFDKHGIFIARHDGVSAAARTVGTSPGHLCSCLKGRRKTCVGFIWKYA